MAKIKGTKIKGTKIKESENYREAKIEETKVFKKAKKGNSIVINLKVITNAKKSANVEFVEKMTKKIAD